MTRWLALVSCLSALVACGPSTGPADAQWSCPREWVRYATGGCGPSVLLCTDDGGAAPGACENIDPSAPRTFVDDAGETGYAFYRRADGGLGGGWHEPGDPDGPPAADWIPDAGPAANDPTWTPRAGFERCPTDWTVSARTACDPSLRTDCPAGAEPIPGARCTPTSIDACGAGEYPDVGSTGTALVAHVRAGADAATADGSTTHPFESIARAAAAVGDDGWVLVADGTYDERLSIAASLHVAGRCAATVTITSSSSTDPVLHVVDGGTIDIRGVRLTGGNFGLRVEDGGNAHASGLVVDHASGAGILVSGARATITLDDSVVRDTQPLDAMSPGRGFQIGLGATGTLSRSAFVSNREAGGYVYSAGTHATVTDSVVRDTQVAASGNYGDGLWVDYGASLTVERSVIDSNHHSGLHAGYPGSSVTLADVIVRGSLPTNSGDGEGLVVASGAALTADHVLVDANAAIGVTAVDPNTHITLSHAVVTRTHADTVRGVGAGVLVQNGASAEVRNSIVAANDNIGIAADGAAAHAIVTDALVAESHASDGHMNAFGLLASDSGVVEATRVRIDHNETAGLVSSGDGSMLSFTEGLVTDTVGTVATHGNGPGASVATGGAMTLTNSVLERNACVGMDTGGTGASLRASDVIVRDTIGVDDECGRSLVAFETGSFEGNHVLLGAARNASIFTTDPGTHVVLTDSVVNPDPHMPSDFGIPASVSNGGDLRLVRVLVTGAPGIGVAAAGEGATLSLTESIVSNGIPVGVDGIAYGAQVYGGATATFDRSLVTGHQVLGMFVADLSHVVLRDSAIRDVRIDPDGLLGRGLAAVDGADVQLVRCAIAHTHESAISASQTGTTLTLDGVLLEDVIPSMRGFGSGVSVATAAQVTMREVAVAGVAGAAISIVPDSFVTPARPSVGHVTDLFVRGVRSSTLALSPGDDTVPAGRAVAYGIHVGTACSFDGVRTTIDGGGFGFFTAGDSFTLRDGVIAGMLDAAGARSGAHEPSLANVVRANNATNDIVQDDALPEAAALPPPTSICPVGGCH